MNHKRFLVMSLLMVLMLAGSAGGIASAVFDIRGEWQSEWGIVTLKTEQRDSQGRSDITGFWGPQERKSGTIDLGAFDPSSNILEFSYHNSNGRDGTARLLLLPDEKKLTGPWSEGLNSGNWTLVRIPAASINGIWQSTFGPLTIQEKNSNSKVSAISGFWGINATAGDIKEGTYDQTTGVLKFNYFDKTTNASGNAVMVLSRDRRTLSGIYSERGSEGAWTMTRQ